MLITTIDFDTALDTNPADWHLRAVYADWLTDQNRENEAEVQYLLAKLQRHPVKCTNRIPKRNKLGFTIFYNGEMVMEDVIEYCWASEDFKPHGLYTLPNYLFEKLPRKTFQYKVMFLTRKQAEDALAHRRNHES